MRSGDVNLYTGYLRDADRYGLYWSSVARSVANNAYSLWFGPTDINPLNDNDYYHGFSLRCLQE